VILMPCRLSSSAGPTPDSISSFGVPMTPAHNTTSRWHGITRVVPRSWSSMPSAAPLWTTMRVTIVLVSTLRLERCAAGRR
jgi:hypothetical protein